MLLSFEFAPYWCELFLDQLDVYFSAMVNRKIIILYLVCYIVIY